MVNLLKQHKKELSHTQYTHTIHSQRKKVRDCNLNHVHDFFDCLYNSYGVSTQEGLLSNINQRLEDIATASSN